MSLVSICLLAAVIGAVGWRLFGDRRTLLIKPPRTRSKWRFVPLASAALIYLVAFATLGAGIVLAPLGFLATVVAFSRVEPPGGAAFWFGAGLNGLLTFVVIVTIVFNDQLNP